MLDLNAFHHLPQLDALFDEIVQAPSGMIVVTGMERRPALEATPALSGGRALVFAMLARRIVDAQPYTRAALVTEHKTPTLRLPARARDHVKVFSVKPGEGFDAALRRALQQGYPILFAETLSRECLSPALVAARSGRRVFTQLDTPLRGAWVARWLRDQCEDPALVQALAWVVATQRVATLCDSCKRQAGDAYEAPGCAACGHTGRRGEIALFDVWHAASGSDPTTLPSVLSFEAYALELVKQGTLAAADAGGLADAGLYHTFQLLTASEQHSAQATEALRTQVTEMEGARRALEQQYRSSIVLQEVGHKLLTLDSVSELAGYLARRARDLCGADRAVLYLLRGDGMAEIEALNGWDGQWLGQRVPFDELFRQSEQGDQAAAFAGYPPGIPTRSADLEGAHVRAGLLVPLVAQRQVLGALLFHSTVRKTFDARDDALLTALANAGAAAMQRADLIDTLRDKIGQLEAAQAEVAKKERLERELELARQVQQNMLPHIFPLLPGVTFYARNEPARQVGGDFYDVFVLDADRVGLVIGDVSDKGMPAALFMALTRSLVRAEAQRELSPLIVLERVHRLLLETAEADQFVTLLYGVLDLTRHTLTYVRAGHDYPLLLRDGQADLLQAGGTVLGILDEQELRLSQEVVSIRPGDSLVLYTDGITDAMNGREEHFGRERLIRVLLEQPGGSPQVLGDAVFNAVAAYQGATDPFDDMTCLIVGLRREK